MRAWDLQVAIFAQLQASASLLALVSAVYDHTPENAVFPYVVIGDGVASKDDADDTVGASHLVDVHTWSRYRGKKETRLIQQEIHEALHRSTLTVANAVFVDCTCELEETFLDDDGLTRHGVQRFRVLLDEVT